MDTALVIILAVVVAGVLLFFLTRKRPELPAEKPEQLAGDKPEQIEAETTATPVARGTQASEEPSTPTQERVAQEPEAPAPQAASAAEGEPQVAVDAEADEESLRQRDVAALRKGLEHTRGGFITRLAKLFGAKQEIDSSVLEEIEEVLITADVGVRTTQRILDGLRTRMQNGELGDKESVWAGIRSQAEAILALDSPPLKLDAKPAVVLIAGVNGVGKTTTIGKLASRYSEAGHKVLLAAGDTYRAAAVLQLEMWGKRVGCPVVRGKENADPGSVIFEAIKRAQEEGFDIVLADTAGRLHTKVPLMDELRKVERTITKATEGRSADEIFLVLDSTTGQNAVQQTHMFKEALDVTGIVLTKLDGTAKGGVILGIVDQHKIPVRYIGLGERVEDLREFDAKLFVEALFAKPDDETLAA